jgi:hypothetical protein
MSKRGAYRFGKKSQHARGRPSRPVALSDGWGISLLCFSAMSLLSALGAVARASDAVEGVDRWKNLDIGILRDTRTKLEWLQEDNGDDIDWNVAKSYCEGKHHGWRLPTLQELKSIYDDRERGVPCGQAVCKVSSRFHLTAAWFWSATQVGQDSSDGIELAWGVLLANGAQTQTVRDASFGSRVLCTRAASGAHGQGLGAIQFRALPRRFS